MDKMSRDQLELPEVDRSFMAGQSQRTAALSSRHHNVSNRSLNTAKKREDLRRIEQDVYDRFFTRIEQRVTRREIETLRDTFGTVTVADGLPYWHFLCERDASGGGAQCAKV